MAEGRCFFFSPVYLRVSEPTVSHSLYVSLDPPQMIVKQLVGALIEIHSRGVFHRDIKPDNILIETSSDLPRVRIIDFGCGTFLTNMLHTVQQGRLVFLTVLFSEPGRHLDRLHRRPSPAVWPLCSVGTYEYTPPEWFLNGSYKAEPTTVWQIGVVMFSILQKRLPFRNRSDIIHQNPVLSSRLSMSKLTTRHTFSGDTHVNTHCLSLTCFLFV